MLLSFAISFTSTQIHCRICLHYTQLEKFCLTFLLSALCQSEFVKVRRACGVYTSSQLLKVSLLLYCCIIVAVLKWRKSLRSVIPVTRLIILYIRVGTVLIRYSEKKTRFPEIGKVC